MLRHTVVFQWNDTMTAQRLADMAAALDALSRLILEIGDYRHGPDLGLADNNADYVIVGDFESIDDYLVYRDHPDHQQFIADHIVGRVAERAAVQYEI